APLLPPPSPHRTTHPTLSLHDALPISLAFPSLRRFLTRRTCLLAMGKILPHPSARSARHWSPQDGGPKGKMIEGRSGGSGRGARDGMSTRPNTRPVKRRYAVFCLKRRL